MPDTDIFSFITRQESLYKQPIPINERWKWGFREHILTSELYNNSQLMNGKTEFTPVKNITRPILNLQHRTEDIDVKDVQIYVNDSDKYHLSFLVKKYHDNVFSVENDLDTFFDELNVSRIDYGVGLSKQLDQPCPEVVPLQSIAFCDQSDLMSGPIGLKHYYSPDQLLAMGKAGWGNKAKGATATLQDVIDLSRTEKKDPTNGAITQMPGRYIEVYEVHGNLPKRFVDVSNDSGEYETRLFICAFYTKKDSMDKGGIILFTAPEPESPFKVIKRAGRGDTFGRCAGFGGAEELFEAQIWTNYDQIRMQGLLDATSKVILHSDDPTITQKQKVRDMENLSVIDHAPGTTIGQVDTVPRSMGLFERSVAEWEQHAKDMGAAQDAVQGKQAPSGTPFAAVQSQIMQSTGLHDYRRGIFAKHLEEIYRDWIIPHIEKKICEGSKFLSTLSLEDLEFVANALVTNQTNDFVKAKILNGEIPTQDEIQAYSKAAQVAFQKKGNKHFIEILKGEFKDVPLAVRVDIAGKSKDLGNMVDKLTNVFKTVIASPYILQSPPIAKLFNKIIEAAGLDPIDLSGFNVPPVPQRRITTSIDYKDLDPQSQQELLKLDGIQTQQPTPTQ